MSNPMRKALLCGALALSLGLAATGHSQPMPALVTGEAALRLGNSDLAALGYQLDEYFLDGTASSYRLNAAPSGDGNWDAVPDAAAPFKTRFVVIRPSNPAKFNGTVLVEWLNVTAGQDTPADWMIAHREILRRGYAYVAVSAQKVGVEGGSSAMGQPSFPLKKANAQRYGSLTHPGDAFSFDIYSQVGASLRKSALGPLKPTRIVGIGESQSAAFLTTYINAVDPIAKVYDGFFVHSRFGSSAGLEGTAMRGSAANYPDYVKFRSNLRVPVLSLITETDLLGARLSGYHASRRNDDARLRVWEVAGTAHADNYMFAGALIDSGTRSSADLAKVFLPLKTSMAGSSSVPFNPGMAHHYVVQAAITGLDTWLRSGRAPASTKPLMLKSGGTADAKPEIMRDANGIAIGGVRTPWTDVPTIRLSGQGDPNSFIGMLAGSGEPIAKAELGKLYPGGKADYLRRFTKSLNTAIRKGHVLREDRQEILDIAAINFDAAL